MFVRYKNKDVFSKTIFWLYLFTLAILILDRNDSFIFGSILRKIKYIYLTFVGLYFLSSYKNIIGYKVKWLLFLLVFHTLLFGFFIINKNVIYQTHIHAREMLIYLLMIFFTYFFIKREGMLKEFIAGNYFVLVACLLWAGLLHRSHFVNPLYFSNVFSSTHSYRTTFGFGHANITGNMVVFGLIYSVFLLEIYRDGGTIKKLFCKRIPRMIVGINIILVEMLFSTQSRTSILAGAVFILLFIWLHWRDLFNLSYSLQIVIFLLCLILILLFILNNGIQTIWENANRSENIRVNYPFFETFNKWYGMGYINSSGFETNEYGFDTYSLDIYYVYILFSTGYLGALIILIYLISITIMIFNVKELDCKKILICFYAAILCTGIGQTNTISYTLVPSIINWTLIYLLIDSSLMEKHI